MGFLGLNSYGLATLGGFFFFWGWIFVASTVCVLLVKQDEHRAQEGSAGSQLLAAYKEMWLVLQLPAVRSLALVLLTVKAPLAAFDALAPLELMSKGVPKEHLAALSMIMLPVSMATQAGRTPHPAPRTPHPAPRTPHPAPRTPHPAPRTPHPAPRTPHPAPRTPHPAPSRPSG